MNAPVIFSSDPVHQQVNRHWRARLHLQVAHKAEKSVLLRTEHEGPLRVQRPFYPESDGCCHVYMLHPPGGLVIGDDLKITVQILPKAQALLTTPSAGKFYGARGHANEQRQQVVLDVDDQACLEWLPQESIIFNSAQARLKTRINIKDGGNFFGWDMARFGRIASGENFDSGSCLQNLELWVNDVPLVIEKNKIIAGSAMQSASWGLRSSNTIGTLLATMVLPRDTIDHLYDRLQSKKEEKCLWGLTQKNQIFVARYLGNSITQCRAGFELIWRETREVFKGKTAVAPRIWNT